MSGGGLVDGVTEDVSGELERGKLELLFGAEAADESALAHLELLGEVADREAFEPNDRRELDGGVERLGTRTCYLDGGAASHRKAEIYRTIVSYILRTVVR